MTDSQVARRLRLCDRSALRFPAIALAALFACSALGCGQDSQIDRKPVYGKIVGAEGRNGMVTFLPIDTSIGPAAIGSFEDGAYRFTADDGPVPGEYSVTIEFEESDFASAATRNRRGGGLITRNPADVGEKAFEPPKTTTASVPVDGPFEIDLELTESASQ